MDVTVRRDGKKYTLHFEKGRNVGGLASEPADRKKTGTVIRWKPDLEVFTDIDIPLEHYRETLRRQAVVNAGVTFRLRTRWRRASSRRRTSSIRTASSTMCRSWRGRRRSPRPISSPPSGAGATARTSRNIR